MKFITQDSPDFAADIAPLLNRSAFSQDIDLAVKEILADIRQNGDDAIIKYALKFDHATLTPDRFLVTAAEIDAAESTLDDATKDAIRTAAAHVRAFSQQRIPQPWSFSPRPGVTLGEKFAPLDRVACYIPGGTAPLISTVVHTVTIAATAGVREICVITPPGPDGTVNPAILFACKTAGATEIYRLGGVYGIAAMGYGTQTIRKVEKIVGPGNAYVTAAKRMMYGEVALDLVAGPSEIMVIADETANPAFIAADMLSQAEHGSGREQAVLVATNSNILERVKAEIDKQSAVLSRAACVQKVIDNGMYLIAVKDVMEAAKLASLYAPEHLEIMTATPESVAANVTAAGALFLGSWTPEPVGDFVAGPSHVLPTGGSGRFFSGLTVELFFRRMSVVHYEKDALLSELPYIQAFARREGLDAHGNSATIRSK